MMKMGRMTSMGKHVENSRKTEETIAVNRCPHCGACCHPCISGVAGWISNSKLTPRTFCGISHSNIGISVESFLQDGSLICSVVHLWQDVKP